MTQPGYSPSATGTFWQILFCMGLCWILWVAPLPPLGHVSAVMWVWGKEILTELSLCYGDRLTHLCVFGLHSAIYIYIYIYIIFLVTFFNLRFSEWSLEVLAVDLVN